MVDLEAAKRRPIPKTQLSGCQPRPDVTLDLINKRILQKWLAARYDRSAFPNEFEIRLKKHNTYEKLAKIIKPTGTHLRGVFFDLGGQADTELASSDEVYELEIYLLHVTEPDTNVAANEAEQAMRKINEWFKKNYCDDQGRWSAIELVDCHVISDAAMTVRQSLSLRQWRMDHMSLREIPNQPMVG